MNDEQKAIDEWFASEEGKSCSKISTLMGNPLDDQFLRNRLWKAFIAGMTAGEIITKRRVSQAFSRTINEA